MKLNSTMDDFPLSFTNLARALSSIITYSGFFYVKDFYNLMSVFALVKLLGKLLKILGKLQLFILIRFFPLSFTKSLLTAIFQNIVTGLLLQ